ncbi:MAG: hypothetical protein AAGA59_22730 [Actinomycetota bacterium]
MSHSEALLGAVTVTEQSRRPADLLRLPRSRYEAFAALVGWGVLMQLLTGRGEQSLWLLPVLLSAIALILRPWSVTAMTVLLVSITGRTLFDLDAPPGFWLLLAVLTPFWLGSLYAAAMRHRSWPRMSEMGPRFGPVFRTGFLIGWAVVAIHQINDGFTSAATSCAVAVYDRSRDLLVVLPELDDGGPGWFPGAVVALQLLLVVGLMFPWMRRLPLAAALLFHVVVGAAAPQLSALAFAFIVLLMRHEVVDAGLDQLSAIGHRHWWPSVVVAIPVVVVMFLATVRVLTGVVAGAEPLGGAPTDFGPSVAALAAVLTGLVLLVLYGAGTFGPPSPTESPTPTEWVGPVALLAGIVVALLGLAPYLGLGTAYAFADATNLRTEEGRWNHHAIPAATSVFDTQTPLVRSLDPDHPDLAPLADDLVVPLDDVRLVEGELRRRLNRTCGDGSADGDDDETEALTLRVGASLATIDDVCADEGLTASDGWFVDRVLGYRPVPIDGACPA